MKQLYKRFKVVGAFGTLLFFMMGAQAQLDLPRGSQLATVSQRIGITDITITYSRPSVNDRDIWGQLVPYGMNNLGFGTAEESPWRAGANENTVFTTTDPITIEGKQLPAGDYGLHMIIEADGRATLIFSKNHTAWGSYFYDPALDALRVDVQSEEIPHVEQLTYTFESVDNSSAVAALSWERKRIPFKIQVDVPEVVLMDIREKLQDSPGFSRQSWEQAANYALNNGGDLDEALGWINAAIEGQFFSEKNFNNLNVKAQILERQGKAQEAEAVMAEAMELGTVLQIHAYGRQLIAQGKPEKAMEVFRGNAKKFKDTWPVDYGLARGYSALGDYKKALRHIKVAQGRAPDQLNKDAIVANIDRLENGEDIN